MRKVLISTLVLGLCVGIGTSSADAAAASVTSRKSDNSAKSVTVTGEGKYVKFTCTYSGSTSNLGSDGYCEIIKKSNAQVSSLNVGGTSSKIASTDYYMDKGVQYVLQADVEILAPSGTSVTAAIR